MENPSWHNWACATSLAPKSDCSCKQCNKTLHGILAIPKPQEAARQRESRPRKKKTRTAVFTASVAVAGSIGGLTATGTFSSSADASSSLSVQTNLDLNKTLSALEGLGYGGKLLSSVGTSGASDSTNCADGATGQVRQFLTHYPCEQYAADTYTMTRQGYTTDVVFAWLEMPTTSLASHYKAVVDTYNTGNPPGVSSAFNGLCYASGQQGATVWTVWIRPTGDLNADRSALQAAAQEDLSSAYLARHCVA
jgi:hypothetical protein